MSSANFENFIAALEAVKQDYTCGVCFELCKDPVTINKCFHLICSEHFAGLKACPTCDISLGNSSTYSSDGLIRCVESARELSRMVSSLEKEPVKKGPAKKQEKIPAGSVTKTESKVNKSHHNVSLLSSISNINKAAEKRNKKGETALHIACRLGKVDRITELLNQGANTNTKDNAGWTPLHEVVQNGRLDLVSLLLQHNTLINVNGQGDETPLHEAVRYNHEDIVEELIINGADINACNCKGETPYQLANVHMKNFINLAAEKLVQTQGFNQSYCTSRIAALHMKLDADDIRVFCVSEFRSVHTKLKQLVKNHSNLHLEAKFTEKVTHLIVDTEDNGHCSSSTDVLQGVLSCIWILSSQWVSKSTKEKLELFNKYEVKGISQKGHQGPKRARYNKYKQLPGLFDGCHFYFHNFTTKYDITKSLVVTKPILTKLVTNAGGVVLRRVPNPELIPETEMLIPYHADKNGKLVNCCHYIIFKDKYEPMYNMQHLKALPLGWLIECMERYELCDP